MGLDLYACTTTQAPPGQVDFEASEATQFHYWRKHPNLHGWMEQLCDKDGSQNSVNVQRTVADLDDLEFAIKATCCRTPPAFSLAHPMAANAMTILLSSPKPVGADRREEYLLYLV